jgi:hypothetical protein
MRPRPACRPCWSSVAGVFPEMTSQVPNKSQALEELFQAFLAGRCGAEQWRGFQQQARVEDVDLWLRKIDVLGDPSDYCRNDFDNETVSGFFLFIDFISALIIQLGPDAIAQTTAYAEASGKFVPWVIRYAGDPRFHPELLSKFA